MMSIKVTIIIRAYNAQDFIEQSVKGALSQNFPRDNFEVIVVNDGSTDSTSKILEQFTKVGNLKIISQDNRGAEVAANNGIKASRGEYITFLDSDDEFSLNFLKELAPILDGDSGIDFCYPDYYEEFNGKKILVSPKNIFENIMIGVLFRKDKLTDEGFFRKSVFFTEYDLLLRTMNKWTSFHCAKPLFTYHRRNDSATGNSNRVEEGLRQLRDLHPDKLEHIKKIRSYKL